MIPIYQVDAFTGQLFEGNPAAVVPLESWIPDIQMQQIAAENNLSETAFFVPLSEGFEIRWFTPKTEVNLCGHATLASAHVLWNHLSFDQNTIVFQSQSGPLSVEKVENLLYLDFPASEYSPIESKPSISYESIFGTSPKEIYQTRRDIMAVFDEESTIANMRPDYQRMMEFETRGFIVTAHSKREGVDFVSRFFGPKVGIIEDPVTGSAHTSLIPYWSSRLDKIDMLAEQLSERGGTLHCEMHGERVKIGGSATTFMTGKIMI